MRTNGKNQNLHIRLTPDEQEEIRERATACGKTVSDYLLSRALEEDDLLESDRALPDAGAMPTDAEKVAWNRFNVDHVQLLRRITVLVKMVRFIIGRYLGVPEAEVDKLIRQYIESTRVDFPDRPDVFPVQDRG
ncbi:MAG: DUF1778 domain-containing protein [Acidobacteria bacterium]|nr:DUF1778 domain-containing protein [Acidobacteriota bacterium]